MISRDLGWWERLCWEEAVMSGANCGTRVRDWICSFQFKNFDPSPPFNRPWARCWGYNDGWNMVLPVRSLWTSSHSAGKGRQTNGGDPGMERQNQETPVKCIECHDTSKIGVLLGARKRNSLTQWGSEKVGGTRGNTFTREKRWGRVQRPKMCKRESQKLALMEGTP